MEFHEKLQLLRRQKGITQEELAESIYVSRTAVSKWESGRGYPSIESLKALSRYYSVSIDDLLSTGEALDIAESDALKARSYLVDIVSGMLDCCAAMLYFIPFFGENPAGAAHTVSLLAASGISQFMKTAYLIAISAVVISGVLTLSLQYCSRSLWDKVKHKISVSAGAVAALLFIAGRQPYAAALLFIFLLMKLILLIKRR